MALEDGNNGRAETSLNKYYSAPNKKVGTANTTVSVCLSVCQVGTHLLLPYIQGADKSLARPGRKQATATEDFDVHISYL